MQSTTNYSMNLVEGTDLVNIPVQLNPNFQTVDAEMFKNKQAGVGTATEVVTGTVHAVARANVDADMFRFTATGAWTAGDTMTLDGSAVTVHLADGTAPATGAYIIGAEVVAVVNGTLVTLLTSAAQPVAGVTSFNSRTGAVVPTASDYDASMVDYDNTVSELTATDVQSAIDELAASVDPKYIAAVTAPSGSAYSSQIATIKAAYDLLTADQKKTAIIFNGPYVYHKMSDDLFTFNDGSATSSGITTINISNNTIYQWRFNTSGNTVNNLTTTTDTLTLELAYLS